MKNKFLKGLVASFALAVSGMANAGLITLTDLQTQTQSGQNFNFIFDNLIDSDGSGGTFTIRAQGDYDGVTSEVLSWDIESILFVSALGGFVNGSGGIGGPFDFVNVFQAAGNIEFQRTYDVSALDLQQILTDGSLNIFVDLSDKVNLHNPPNFVEVTFSYNSLVSAVPEPSTLAIFALGVMGLASRRFKKQA